jgi:hypothetical protein
MVVGVAVRVTSAGAGAPMTPTGPLPVPLAPLAPQPAKIKALTTAATAPRTARCMFMVIPFSAGSRAPF